jgi:hypothetical protein
MDGTTTDDVINMIAPVYRASKGEATGSMTHTTCINL